MHSLTVWVLPKWGHLKTVSSNIAKRLIEVTLLNYFHQPPFWQYLVSGSGFLFPYAQHSLCPKVGVQTSHNLLKVFIVFLNVVRHTNKINSRAEWLVAFRFFYKFGKGVCNFLWILLRIVF